MSHDFRKTTGRRFGSTKGDDLSVTPRIQKELTVIVNDFNERFVNLKEKIDLQTEALDVLVDVIDRLDTNMSEIKERLDRIDPPGPPE